MQKIKNIYPNLLIMVGFIAIGMAIGIAFGYGFIALDDAGAFPQFSRASWKLIESPIKFEHIANATTYTIWARTGDNKFYYKDTYCLGRSNCNMWTETNEISVISDKDYDPTRINKSTCTPNGIKYPRDPQGSVVECALSIEYIGNETRIIVYHALLEDGTMWVWESSGPWYVGLGMIIMLVSPFIGIALGLLAFKGFQKYQKSKIKLQEANNIKQ